MEEKTDAGRAGASAGTLPSSATEWFELTAPLIDTEPAEATTDRVLAIVRRHAEQVVDRTGMAVDLDRVEFDATHELRARHGYHESEFVKLSLHSLERNGWTALLRTVRHELVHVWQYQNEAFDDGPTRFDSVHGPSFERWEDVLDVAKRSPYPAADYRWRVYCPDCETYIERHHRLGKKVKAALDDGLYCGACGEGTLGDLVVEREGEVVTAADVLDG